MGQVCFCNHYFRSTSLLKEIGTNFISGGAGVWLQYNACADTALYECVSGRPNVDREETRCPQAHYGHP